MGNKISDLRKGEEEALKSQGGTIGVRRRATNWKQVIMTIKKSNYVASTFYQRMRISRNRTDPALATMQGIIIYTLLGNQTIFDMKNM